MKLKLRTRLTFTHLNTIALSRRVQRDVWLHDRPAVAVVVLVAAKPVVAQQDGRGAFVARVVSWRPVLGMVRVVGHRTQVNGHFIGARRGQGGAVVRGDIQLLGH